MKSKRITFIVNPSSSNGSTGKQWPRIRAKARDRLGPFRTLITTGRGDATQLARRAILSGDDIIVSVGGDGTFNEVINGVLNEEGLLEPGVLLGFIPRGTGCDLAKSIPIQRDLDRALDNILGRQTRWIDLGKLRYRGDDGRELYRYFHNVMSFGLGGEVDERVNKTTKAFGGFMSFVLATLISVLSYKRKRIRLSVDNCFDEEVRIWNVAVANGQYHGGGMWVAPGAALNDGLFHVTVIGDMSLTEVLWNLPKLYNGKIYELKKVRMLTGRRIEASSFQSVLMDVDGEQVGRLPVVIEIVPYILPIICDV